MGKTKTAQTVETAIVKTTGGALATYDASQYALMTLESGDGGDDMAEALTANIGDGQLSAFDFERIRVPAGGGIGWEVVDLTTGEIGVATEIVGIVVGWSDQKAFWKVGLDDKTAEKKPPDCFSADLIKGQGDPGIMCATCPNNKFGTAKGGAGRGKACKDTRLLFICRSEDIMPILLICPPTSLKAVKKYFTTLTSRSVPYYRAVTKFVLAKDKNAQGIEFSKVTPTLIGVLPGEQFSATKRFAGLVRKMLGQRAISVRPEDLRGGASDDVTDANPQSDTVEGGIMVGGQIVGAGAGAAGGAGRPGDQNAGGKPGDDQTL